jgi:aldehyde:ferredoxin oxidoreductase
MRFWKHAEETFVPLQEETEAMERGNVYMGRVLIVDLEEATCEEEELGEALIRERIGGVAINLCLYRRFQDRDPIVIGTGMLTGTFAPAGCSGVITARSPRSGRVCHMPLTWQTAVELKFSGYDFVVILGRSEKPVRLWLHDELAELADAGKMWGKDTWETTDGLRFEHGDEYVQVLTIGPAGEKGHGIAQLSEDYWGSRDLFGFGGVFGRKRLKALAMRGLGTLEVAEGFFDASIELNEKIRARGFEGRQGMIPILEALGADAGGLGTMKRQVHRNVASFNCMYPYNSFVMIDDDPGFLKESGSGEPGVLLTDVGGAASLLFLKDAAARVMRTVNRLGLDPLACGRILAKRGATEVSKAEEELKKIADKGSGLVEEGLENAYGVGLWPLSDAIEVRLVQALSVFSHTIPPVPVFHGYETFSVSENPVDRARWWMEVQGAAYIMGICPLSVLLSPEFTLDQMAALGAGASGLEELTGQRLQKEVTRSLAESQELSRPTGEIPASWKTAEFDQALKALNNI